MAQHTSRTWLSTSIEATAGQTEALLPPAPASGKAELRQDSRHGTMQKGLGVHP